MRRKGGIFLIGLAVLLGFIGITGGMFIYWLTTFKIHIYQVIVEEYHYNRVQEIPLALISSDFEGKSFVERVNKAYFGFYSEEEKKEFEKGVSEIVTEQVGEGYWWSLSTENVSFSSVLLEIGSCRVIESHPHSVPVGTICQCSDECPNAGEIVALFPSYTSCDKPSILARCMGSLTINITFFNETFPFPLVFNGSCFMTKMRFNAYA